MYDDATSGASRYINAAWQRMYRNNEYECPYHHRRLGDLFKKQLGKHFMTRRYLLPVNDVWGPRSDHRAHVVGDPRTAPCWFYHCDERIANIVII